MICGGLSVTFPPDKYLVVVIVFNKIGWIFFLTVLLGVFEGSESTLDRTGGDTTPGGYITNFYILEVDTNNGVADIIVSWG